MSEKYYYFHACYHNDNAARLVSAVYKVSASCRAEAMQKAFAEMIPYCANDISFEEICEGIYEWYKSGEMPCQYIKWSMSGDPHR